MHILIITACGFQVPSAVSNRLNAYGRGLGELGNRVSIISLSDTQDDLRSVSAEYPLISYFGFSRRVHRFRIFRFFYSFSAGRSVANWISKSEFGKPDTVIYYGMLIPARIPISKICEKSSIPTFDEITEYPFVGRQIKWHRRLEYKIFMRKYMQKNSGILCISRGIESFITSFLQQQNRCIPVRLFGLIVETDKFSCHESITDPFPCVWGVHPYIAYCGNMYGEKDGVPDLIKAFSLACDTHPDLHLVIIGDNTDSIRMSPINETLKDLQFKESIHFTGRVAWETMHAFMCNALALVLAKPDNVQNQGSFPTKLGEYLACGKPVICTSVGDIPVYLKHYENALLAEPGNTSSFAEQICLCVENAQLRFRLSQNAKTLAETEFSHIKQARLLLAYITQVSGA